MSAARRKQAIHEFIKATRILARERKTQMIHEHVPGLMDPSLVVVLRDGGVGWLPLRDAAERVGVPDDPATVQQVWEYQFACPCWVVGRVT